MMLDQAQTAATTAEQAAPANEPAAPTTTTTAPAAPTRQDLAGMFQEALDAEDAKAAPAQPQKSAPADDAEPLEETSERVTAETTQEDSAPEAPDPARPAGGPSGMSETDRAVFEQLPPELKTWVSKRENEMRADYTRKTQDIAAHRSAVVEERQALAGQLQQYDQILARFTDREIAPPDPALRNTDPVAFEDQLAQYVHADHLRKKAAAERAGVQEQQKALYDQQVRENVAREEHLLEEMKSPLARSSKDSPQLRKAVFEYGAKQGIPVARLRLADALEMTMLDKARRYDALQAAKATAKPVVETAPKMMKPGPTKAIGRPSNMTVAVRNLDAAPSRNNLAAAYLAQLNSER